VIGRVLARHVDHWGSFVWVAGGGGRLGGDPVGPHPGKWSGTCRTNNLWLRQVRCAFSQTHCSVEGGAGFGPPILRFRACERSSGTLQGKTSTRLRVDLRLSARTAGGQLRSLRRLGKRVDEISGTIRSEATAGPSRPPGRPSLYRSRLARSVSSRGDAGTTATDRPP